MNITNFYTQRLNSGTDITPQAEKDFFSVYSYNRPIEGCDIKYEEAYNRFKNNPYFIQKFNSLAYKVIRQQIDGTIGDSQDIITFTNHFFLIGSKIIKSSTILKAMELLLVEQDKMFSAERRTANSNFPTEMSTKFLTTSFTYDLQTEPIEKKTKDKDGNEKIETSYPIWTKEDGWNENGEPIWGSTLGNEKGDRKALDDISVKYRITFKIDALARLATSAYTG